VPEIPFFQLSRAYYGHLVDSQKRASATAGVIARTPDITPAQIAECERLAKLSPPLSTNEMPGALGLFRGESIDYILAKAQYNDAGHPQVLYILTPMAPLRLLGGNVLALQSLAMMDMPSFATTKANLVPYELRDPKPPSAEEQTDALLNLLLYCNDSFSHVKDILAGLIQGWPLAIVNSPPSMEKRLQFLQGLISLLPIPARVGITFATNVTDPQMGQVQIKFLSQHAMPAQHLVYDWGGGKLLTPAPDDSYSHYIIAQLRLDPSLVIEKTEQLSRTTVWRAMHRENLAQVLAWVSRRASIDQAVLNNQPADRDIVAAVLREDPTLPDDLRLAYARHLLAFALALNEPASADIVPAVCVTNPAIAQSIADQLHTASENNQSQIAYGLLERWLLRFPEASDLQWHTLLHAVAKQHLKDLLAQDRIQDAISFITHVRQADPTLRLIEIIPDLIRSSVGVARHHSGLANVVFLTAVEALPPGDLYRILSDTQFRQQFPQELQTALSYLQPEPRKPVPPHVLDQGARVFGDGKRMLVLIRLAEWAIYLERTELIDTAALQALLVLAQSPQSERFRHLILQVVDELSEVSILEALEPPGMRVLVQLLLQIEEYDRAVGQLVFYQNQVLGLDRLEEFTNLAGEVFRMAALSPDALNKSLTYLEGSPIRPEPRAMIYCNALMNRQWADDQQYAARQITTMIFNDYHLVATISHEHTLKLLDFHARSHNTLDTLRVAAALVDHTLNMGAEGAALLVQMWPAITGDDEATDAALELLRRFMRGISFGQIPTLLPYFDKELGPVVGRVLRATYLMRLVMGQTDDQNHPASLAEAQRQGISFDDYEKMTQPTLMRFAAEVQTAAQLFVDLAAIYHTDKKIPPIHRLRHDLDTMTGGLSEQDRKRVAANFLNIIRQVYELGRERSNRSGKQAITEQFIRAQTMPQSGVDLLRFVGGHFARHQTIPLNLKREEMGHIFGTRSATMILRETNAITRLLSGLQIAFEHQDPGQISTQALAAELNSLWGSLSLYNQRQIQEQFAQGCQQLAEVIGIMSDNANDRIVSNSGPARQLDTGQRQPRTALETLRWTHGYFARKHTR
jgi:hypothetical protein